MTEEIKKKKHRLKDITFEHAGAHIALVGGAVGGPANGVETVLFKSKGTEDISEQEMQQLLEKASGKTEVEKAKFNSEVRTLLRESLDKQFAGKYEWLYLEDFSDSEIVFSTDAGMFIVNYSLSGDDGYVFEDKAIGVEYKSILVENGSVKLSVDAQEKLSEGVYSLVTKALDNPETNQRVVDAVGVTLEKAKVKMQEEIQKAVDAAKVEAAAELATVQAELVKAKEALSIVEAEKKATVLKARQDAVAKFDKDGAEALVKATEALADEAFATLLKSLSVGKAAVEESELFKQQSQAGSEKPAEVENGTAELIKAKYAPKQ